jgi:arabinofuranan 3-O-arabinosyltransferase
VGRVVLTDTNRRRSTAAGRLGGSQGPLLPASGDPGGSRTLFDPDRQTVLEVSGGSVSATDVGSVFGPVAAGAPENAVDGDPNTAWLFGDFGRAVGQSITVRFDQPRLVPRVTVRVRTADAQRISKVRIETGGVRADRPVDASGRAVLALPRRTVADSVKVTVLGVSGAGFNLVGVQEVQIPGVRLARIARTPRTMEQLVDGLNPAALAALRRTPLDVVLTRVRGTASATDDEETGLDRDLAIPVTRRYRATAVIRVGPRLSERDLDLLAGAHGPVRASSTSRAFGLPTVRGLAGGRRTDRYGLGAGRPGRGAVADHRRTAAPDRLGQPHADRPRRDRVAGPDHQGPAQPRWRTRHRRRSRSRTTRIPVPSQVASTVRITVLATLTGNPAGAVRIAEVGFGGARMAFSADRSARACVPVATVDGAPVLIASAAADPVRGSGALGRLAAR